MRAFFWISEDWGWISPQRVTRFNLVERLSNHSHAEVVEYPDVTFEDSILRGGGWRCRRPASRAATRLPPMWSSGPRVSGSGLLRPNPPDPAVHRRWISVDRLRVLEKIFSRISVLGAHCFVAVVCGGGFLHSNRNCCARHGGSTFSREGTSGSCSREEGLL